MARGNNQRPLAEYWPLFIEGILKDLVFLPYIMSIDRLGFLIGLMIYVADVVALVYSIVEERSAKLLITFILINFFEGSSRHG